MLEADIGPLLARHLPTGESGPTLDPKANDIGPLIKLYWPTSGPTYTCYLGSSSRIHPRQLL